ncbi:MAG: tetratricopeptide repeat protein [Planctomycetes bacterium]|nr:tetratricopeptide repeat protein [Planctomycetota bacterium]
MVNEHSKRGQTLLRRGKIVEAIGEFKRALDIDPDCSETYIHLGCAYEALEKWERAVKAYRELARLRPNDASAHYSLGTALKNSCRWKEAVQCFEEALRLTRL